ncbi:MAG: methylmalonyl-CoA mutase [Calditrichaeota bacterium]|nr:methylmalonyl-CoA mutase [Calditrichota bacterium]MCB9391173.1 methylmalonyl-CoA mutase [Calditrichota bacterium]
MNNDDQTSRRSEWHAALQKLITKSPERRSEFLTESGLAVDALYEPGSDFCHERDLGFPGFFPFTRGVQPNMYRGRFWTMRQYAGFGTAEESNARYKYLLSQGTTGLSVAFDLPTQIGFDSDSAEAVGEVGRVGVAVCSLDDMQVLFDGVPLEKISTSMTINATASTLMAMYIAVARSRGIPESSLEGTVQNDILKEFIARGTYIYPPGHSLRLVTDVIEYCRVNLPKWNTISISGYHIREAGSTAIQELAFTFADAIAYVEAALARGMDIDEFAPRLAFFWGCHNNFFEEIAKFRASRRVWSRIVRDRFGAKSARSMMLRFHTQTAGCTLTAQQPDNNAVRVTLQALAAVLGGTQSLHTNALDEALGLPTERTAQLALRTQQIIANESGVTDTVDPVGGSYYIESLTNRIEKAVWEELERIDQLGGSVKAIEAHYFQEAIAREAYRYQKDVESQDRIIVGVNRYHAEREAEAPVMKVDPSLEVKQRVRLGELRKSRSSVHVTNVLNRLRTTALSNENLMPVLIDAVELKTTLGEISNCLRETWGTYRDA